jgi:hypothetical protein
MKRFLLVVAVVAGFAGCDKPAAEDCRAALEKMQDLLGTRGVMTSGDLEGEVRRCRGGSTRETVACVIAAKSQAELNACDFMTRKPSGQ